MLHQYAEVQAIRAKDYKDFVKIIQLMIFRTNFSYYTQLKAQQLIKPIFAPSKTPRNIRCKFKIYPAVKLLYVGGHNPPPNLREALSKFQVDEDRTYVVAKAWPCHARFLASVTKFVNELEYSPTQGNTHGCTWLELAILYESRQHHRIPANHKCEDDTSPAAIRTTIHQATHVFSQAMRNVVNLITTLPTRLPEVSTAEHEYQCLVHANHLNDLLRPAEAAMHRLIDMGFCNPIPSTKILPKISQGEDAHIHKTLLALIGTTQTDAWKTLNEDTLLVCHQKVNLKQPIPWTRPTTLGPEVIFTKLQGSRPSKRTRCTTHGRAPSGASHTVPRGLHAFFRPGNQETPNSEVTPTQTPPDQEAVVHSHNKEEVIPKDNAQTEKHEHTATQRPDKQTEARPTGTTTQAPSGEGHANPSIIPFQTSYTTNTQIHLANCELGHHLKKLYAYAASIQREKDWLNDHLEEDPDTILSHVCMRGAHIEDECEEHATYSGPSKCECPLPSPQAKLFANFSAAHSAINGEKDEALSCTAQSPARSSNDTRPRSRSPHRQQGQGPTSSNGVSNTRHPDITKNTIHPPASNYVRDITEEELLKSDTDEENPPPTHAARPTHSPLHHPQAAAPANDYPHGPNCPKGHHDKLMNEFRATIANELNWIYANPGHDKQTIGIHITKLL